MVEQYWWNSYGGTVMVEQLQCNSTEGTVMVEHKCRTVMVKQ